MKRTKMPYLVALVVTIAALLLSTWGTGVSLAQDAEPPEPTATTTTLPDAEDPGDDCSQLDRLMDLCRDDGTRCTAERIAVEVLMSGLGGFPAGQCMQSPWALLVLFFGSLSP